MNHPPSSPLRWLLTVAAILVLALPAVPALAQSTSGQTTGRGQVTIDAPVSGATIRNGNQIDVGGWAVDRTGPGTGVDEVRVYLDGPMDGNGTLLGTANYGGSRPDVAQVLGSSAFASSGFDFLWTPTRLSGGSHTIYVFAHSINDGWSSSAVTINADAPATPPSGGGYGSGGYGPGYGPGGYGPGYDSGYGSGGYGPGYGYGAMPPYDDYYGGGGRACIMIYPPPPGCGGPILPPPYYPPYYPGIPPVAPGGLLAPTNVSVSARTGTTVTLTFTPVPGATSYRVFQTIGATPATLGTQTASSVVVTGLAPNATFTFYVVAVDANGLQSPPSPPITTTTTAGP